MVQFNPGSIHTAIAPITVLPAGLSCTAELYLVSNGTKVVTSGLKSFTSTGAKQNVALPIIMPSAEGTYPVWLDVFAEGMLIGAYEAVEDVVIVPVPTVTFTLFIRGAPGPVGTEQSTYWYVEVLATDITSPRARTTAPIIVTCPPTCTLRILVEDLDLPLWLLDARVTGTFKDGYTYVFDYSTHTFEEIGAAPSFISLKMPPTVESGREFSVESTWFLPNPYLGGAPYYYIFIAAGGKVCEAYPGSKNCCWAEVQHLLVDNPPHGVNTIVDEEHKYEAYWDFECRCDRFYASRTIYKVFMAPGRYEIRAKWDAACRAPERSVPWTYLGVIGYVDVVEPVCTTAEHSALEEWRALKAEYQARIDEINASPISSSDKGWLLHEAGEYFSPRISDAKERAGACFYYSEEARIR